MDPNKCQVLTTKGTQCSKKHKVNSQHCTLHENKREEAGPHRFASEQLAIKHKFERSKQIRDFQERRETATGAQEIRVITNEETIAEAYMTVRHRTELQALRDSQATEIIANGGINPDEPARMRRELKDLEAQSIRTSHWIIRRWARIAERNHFLPELDAIRTRVRQIGQQPHITQRNIEIVQDLDRRITERLDEFMARAMQDIENGGAIQGWGGEPVPAAQRLGARAMALPPANQQQLARLANDNQNVHTQLVVEQTKKNVQEILKIPVPEIFKWQRNKLSMTYKTIVMFCHLSPKSAWQFSSMYCSDATIYDLEPGIFGKVVDGVWQFIKNSPDRVDLKKILSAELRDNIGMCAQGNLSRMCNVLQGYMDGIGQKESVSEILGREFPKLMELENPVEREARGAAILRENAVPEGEWENWLEPLRS
uniref:Uncharacterized protein n=1 Tax=viral metagenome TaxID=1070528 RepID=A0A6C0CHX2_9ZZZZ